MRRIILTALFSGSAFLAAASTDAQTPTLPYDHIHVNVPDPAVAASWYEKNFGGRRITEAPDRLMFGSTRFMFLRKADAKPSAGSAVDHVGFSFADLDAKMKEFEAAGVKVVTPAREVPGLFKLAFVEDPWGTRIEVVQDPELLGLHHVHMRGPEHRRSVCLAAREVRRSADPAQGPARRHEVQRAWLQRYVDSRAAGRRRAQRRPCDRSHRLALDRATGENDRRPARQRA